MYCQSNETIEIVMGTLAKTLITLKGLPQKYLFEKLTAAPHQSQSRLLLKIINENRNTEYGKKNNFNKISGVEEFQNNIPVNSYTDLEPYINKMVHGGINILTDEPPILFNVTSGTTDKPKYIPVTNTTKKRNVLTHHQWLYRALTGHLDFLNGKYLLISSPAIEGYTQSGIPYGSLSGLIYKNLPPIVRRSYALPYELGHIQNYDLRYYIAARLALEKDISFIATPNPTTLVKLAETCAIYQDEIVKSMYEGELFTSFTFDINKNDQNIIDSIVASLKPNKSRAEFCSNIIEKHKNLKPSCCWPSLKLIGCWLGGSVGYHANKLNDDYGDIPKRDLGYAASEGCFTLPYTDNTPGGILVLQNNFYEFIKEEDVHAAMPRVCLSHELEKGGKYKVIITNESGLYRYDINDMIKVEGFYNSTPVISFAGKTGDFINITGEKVHINQILMSFRTVSSELRVKINQFRVVPNYEKLRYEIFIQFEEDIPDEIIRNKLIPAIDEALSDANMEYAQKRKSKRLYYPCIHVMDRKWEEDVKKAFLVSGKRDIQYKWKTISGDFLQEDRVYVNNTVYYEQ